MDKKLAELDGEESTTPLERSTTSRPAAVKKQRKSHPALITLLAVILIAGGAVAGILGYKYLFEKSVQPLPSEQKSADSQSTSSSDVQAKAVVAGIKSKLKNAQSKIIDTSDSSALAEGGFTGFGVQAYQPAHYEYKTAPQKYYGVTVAGNSRESVLADAVTMRDSLINSKFMSASPNVNLQGQDFLPATTEFYHATAVCTVAMDAIKQPAGNFQAHLGCADVSSYSDNAELAKKLNVAAQIDTVASTPMSGVVVARVKVTDSKTPGYQHAESQVFNQYDPIRGAPLLYYRTPDEKWHFFKSTQQELACSDYSSDDLKKAYLTTQCFDNNGKETTVKL